jgi:hypothetical protein
MFGDYGAGAENHTRMRFETDGDIYFYKFAVGSALETAGECIHIEPGGDVTFSESIAANSFSGDGSALTNLDASALTSGTVPAASLPRISSRVSSDQTSSSATLADVTGLTAAVGAGRKYHFRCLIHHQSSISTEGLGLAINGPAGMTNICAEAQIYTAGAGTVMMDVITAVETAVQNTTGVSVSVKPAYISGYFETGANAGTFAIRFKAETGGGNSVTIKAGSFLILEEVA